MPDPVAHTYFGRQVLSRLPAPVAGAIDIPIFDRAVQGPDPWSAIGFYGGKYKPYAVRSGILHHTAVGAFFTALTRAAGAYPAAPVFSVLAGGICHYCLDKGTHPYIICKCGAYDGTPATWRYRNGHLRLEHAIDCYLIRRVYGQVPWHFSICRQILYQKQYPASLRAPLDAVYREVYGWEHTFDLLAVALRDERRFYRLMQDPLGVVQLLLRPVSRGRTDYRLYSYYHRDIDSAQVDYLNERHTPWRHPYDPSIVSSDSFFDLFSKAEAEAVSMLRAAYAHLYEGRPLPDAGFGNADYSSGFDCGDPRNQRTPCYEPLEYP